MNPFAFMFAVFFIALLFPVFKGMIEDCWAMDVQSGPVGSWSDRAFQFFLGLILMMVFVALCFAAIYFGTLPSQVFDR